MSNNVKSLDTMKKIIAIFAVALLAFPMNSKADTKQSYGEIKSDTVQGLRHYKGGDNWFITLHAGGNMTLGENVRPRDIKDVLGFSGGLSVGKYFFNMLINGLFMQIVHPLIKLPLRKE